MSFYKTWFVFTLYANLALAAKTFSNTLLVFARDTTAANNAVSGLQGYGISYQTVIVPSNGISTLPTLSSSSTTGNYGGIVVLSDVAYQTSTGFFTALTDDQWKALYAYQESFGVRMVRMDVFPTADLGVTVVSQGCCKDGVEQLMSFNDTSGFPTANIKSYVVQSNIIKKIY